MFGFLPLHHGLDLIQAILPAGILHAVGNNHKQHLIRPVFRGHRLLYRRDLPNGLSHGVQQGRAAPDIILPLRDRRHCLDLQPVMEQFVLVIKQYRRDPDAARLRFLLLQHGVVAADGVRFQTAHGATTVTEKDQFQFLFTHKKFLPSECVFLSDERISCFPGKLVASKATFYGSYRQPQSLW